MERGRNSFFGDFGCFALLEHIQVLLMRGLLQSRSHDALAHLLVLHSRLSVRPELLALANFEILHLWFQNNKLNDRIALSLVFKKANVASVWVVRCTDAARVICWDYAKIKQSPQLRLIQKLFVDVIRKELHDKRINVCVEHPHFETVPVF